MSWQGRSSFSMIQHQLLEKRLRKHEENTNRYQCQKRHTLRKTQPSVAIFQRECFHTCFPNYFGPIRFIWTEDVRKHWSIVYPVFILPIQGY